MAKNTQHSKKVARKPNTSHKSVAKTPTAVQKMRKKAAMPIQAMLGRTKKLLLRRPHRSFHRTRRRDYVRSLKLPGYWAFTNQVRKTLWQHKKLFIGLAVLYGALTAALIGIASQDTYAQISDALRSTSGELFEGNWGEIGKAGLLLATGVSGTFSSIPGDAQKIYATILGLFTWLTTVWLLRAILAGRKPKLRDGLYNAGAPILPTFLLGLVLVVQLLPIALAAIGFAAASASGLLEGGVEAMLFWVSASLLAGLSLYWVTSTFIALIVITLPGMYPLQALKTAGDLVIGRRVRLLLRFLWMAFILVVVWAIVMVPVILFDTWLKGIWPAIQWLPIVPCALLVMSTLTMIWTSAYIYLLYRRVVDDDAAPA